MSYLIARYWPRALIAVCLLAIAWVIGSGLYRWGYDTANVRAERIIGEFAKAEAEAQAKAREAERRAAERIAEIEAAQAAKQERIESEVEARTRDLRAGNLRLRREIAALATASVSREAAATAESEAAAARGAELVAAAVGVGAACDARIEALIEAYEATP